MTEPLLPLRRGGATTPEERAAAALLQQLPAPQTDGATVDRVWRRVAAKRPHARRIAWIVSGALAAGIGGLLLLPLRNHPPVALAQARIVLLRGAVSRAPVADQWSAATEGAVLKAGESLRTMTSAQALLNVPGISALLLSQDGQVAVERTPQGVVVRLARGTVTAKVAHRKPGESFVVETAYARVTVVGTLFSVTAGNDGVTSVSVHEGAVAVTTAAGEAERVVAGTRWSGGRAGRDQDQVSQPVATLLEATLVNPHAASLRALFDATLVADAQPAKRKAPVAAPAVEPPVVPPVAVAMLSPRPGSAPRKHAKPAAAPVPDDPYGHAIELEAQGQHAEAATAFARAAEIDPRHAEAALYELGRIERVRLHDPLKALDAFQQFRQRYPTGTFLPEVDLSVLEIDGALGRTSEQLAESEHFLSAHPGDEHADDVRLSLGHMRRDRGDCAGALTLYRAITKPSRLDDATYSVAYCLAQLGDRAGADETLRAYLTRFPQGVHRADAMKALGEGR